MPTADRSSPPLAFHPYRIVVGVGVLIVLGSMSLPFVTAPAGSRSSVTLDAWPVLALLVPVFALSVVPDHSRPLPRSFGAASAVFVALALPTAVVTLLDAAVVAGSVGGSVGLGPWLLLMGCLVTGIGVWLNLAGGRRAARGRERERRLAAELDENPFGGPLFDSLEFEVPVSEGSPAASPGPTVPLAEAPAGGRQADVPTASADAEAVPTLIIEAQRAAIRVADDADEGRLSGD